MFSDVINLTTDKSKEVLFINFLFIKTACIIIQKIF